MKSFAKILLISALGGMISLGAYKMFIEDTPTRTTYIETAPERVVQTKMGDTPLEGFTYAADKTVNAVVHVKTAVETPGGYAYRSPLEFFFGAPPQQQGPEIQLGSGSGVIMSKDGYIVTNNHVIANAEKILVSLNSGEEYEARVVGTDPTTDIALIKIDAAGLPFLTFSNSDDVQVGEWVLAVGNPFNLTSTVTAGIISAKSRSIGIIRERAAIESFIQTDAAVNPGNSGGALVNLNGDLIGINSAISTHTGSYEGYSFAVPSNIVKKVVQDLLEFGAVQRAFIGVTINDVTPRLAEELELPVVQGVYIQGVAEDGAANEAGIKTGDVIVSIDDREVKKSSELQEIIGRKRPGDRVDIVVNREGSRESFSVKLRNLDGTTDVVRPAEVKSFAAQLGADLEPLKSDQKRKLGVSHGLVVEDLKDGILASHGVPEGFVITYINQRPIRETEDINKAVIGLEPRDPVVIQGYTPDGKARYIAFGY